jgi:hypothetical protein
MTHIYSAIVDRVVKSSVRLNTSEGHPISRALSSPQTKGGRKPNQRLSALRMAFDTKRQDRVIGGQGKTTVIFAKGSHQRTGDRAVFRNM